METFKQFAVNLAKEAGGIMRANFMLGMKKEWKEDGSPITETDKRINQLVLDSIERQFPYHSVLAEEGSAIRDGSEYTWVCDPVDGTIPFSHGIPTSMFSLALTKDGKPILGVAFDPFLDRLLYSEKGKSVQLNGDKVSVSPQKSLAKQLFDVEVPSALTDFVSIGNLWHEIRMREGKVIQLASIVYGGMLVACGETGGAIYFGKGAHDIAALKIIVEEAGGRVTDIDGNEQRYDRPINGAVISNGHVHDQLLEVIRKSGALTQI